MNREFLSCGAGTVVRGLIGIGVVSLAVSGCAFTVNDVEVGYRYPDKAKVSAPGSAVTVGAFKDSRDVHNKRLIMNKKNLNGDTTSGGYQAEKPLSQIVRDGVVLALQAAQVQIKSAAPLELSGQLEDFGSEMIMGWWEGEFKGKLTVRFHLNDKASGKTVWKDTFVGTGSVKGGEGPEGALAASLDDLLFDLMSDKSFLDAMSVRGGALPPLSQTMLSSPERPSHVPETAAPAPSAMAFAPGAEARLRAAGHARPTPDSDVVSGLQQGASVKLKATMRNTTGAWWYVTGPDAAGWVREVDLESTNP
jgi:hypothetical protein